MKKGDWNGGSKARHQVVPDKSTSGRETCSCCLAMREVAWSAAFFSIGALLLSAISQLDAGNASLKTLGLDAMPALVKWPIMIWMALLVFALLSQAVKCLKLPASPLPGAKPTGKPDSGGYNLPPIFPGLPPGPLIPAAAAAAVVIAVTLRVHPVVDNPDPVRIPVTLNAAAAKEQPAIPVPVTLAASGALAVPITFTPSELKQRIELNATGKTEVILKPDADVQALMTNLTVVAKAILKEPPARGGDDVAKLVQATGALRDASSSMLVWSAKAEQDLEAYGKSLHDLVSQLNGLKVDVDFLRQATLPMVQTQFPERWRDCTGKSGPPPTNTSSDDCERVRALLKQVSTLRQGAPGTGGVARTSSTEIVQVNGK